MGVKKGKACCHLIIIQFASTIIGAEKFQCHWKHRSSKIQALHEDLIKYICGKGPFAVTSHVLDEIRTKTGLTIPVSTFRCALLRLGIQSRPTNFVQMIREPNKVKRLGFARRCIESNDQFDDVIFTDESTICLEAYGRRMKCIQGETPPLAPVPKHPLKIHVWAGISKRGATGLYMFSNILDGPSFCRILEETLLPFTSQAFPDGYRLWQDNDPKHTSKVAKAFYEQKEINWWRTPPESPDLNPIENVWHQLKHHLRTRVRPKNKEELLSGMRQFWEMAMTVEQCTRYINHVQRVLPKVVAAEGGPSGQ